MFPAVFICFVLPSVAQGRPALPSQVIYRTYRKRATIVTEILISCDVFKELTELREPIRRFVEENTAIMSEVDYADAEKVFLKLGMIPYVITLRY